MKHPVGVGDGVPGIGLAVGAQKNVACGVTRRGLAIVDRDVLAAIGEMDHHEPAAADVARARISHGHREAGCDRGVDRVAALLQNVGADVGCDLLLCDNHAMFGHGRMNGVERRRGIDAPAALLRRPGQRQCAQQRKGCEYSCRKIYHQDFRRGL